MFANLIVPFLSPPCQFWPTFLVEHQNRNLINFANFDRTRNVDQIDFLIQNHRITGEAKDRKNKPIDVLEIGNIIAKIPTSSKIHLVFASSMKKKTYFTKNNLCFREYLMTNCSVSQQNFEFIDSCAFYRVKVPLLSANLFNDLELTPVVGLPLISRPADIRCLVIFIEMGYIDNDNLTV